MNAPTTQATDGGVSARDLLIAGAKEINRLRTANAALATSLKELLDAHDACEAAFHASYKVGEAFEHNQAVTVASERKHAAFKAARAALASVEPQS